MRLHLNSLAAVIALVVSTTAGAQDITKKPVTGADRKKAAAATAAPKTEETSTKPTEPVDSPPSVVASPTTAQPATTTPPATVEGPDEPAAPQTTAPGQTATTPGQSQTSPGEASDMTPAQTGTTPSGQPVPSGQPQNNQVTAATAADVKAGTAVFDQTGGPVGKIVSATAKEAVIDTGTVRAAIPLSSFGKNDKGLVISMSKDDIDAAAKKAAPKKK